MTEVLVCLCGINIVAMHNTSKRIMFETAK